MHIQRILPRKIELLRILLIVAIVFPMLILLRGKNSIIVTPASRYLRELGLLYTSLLTVTKCLQLFHYWVSKLLLSAKKISLHILTEVLFITCITPLVVGGWGWVFLPELFRGGDLRVILLVLLINLFIEVIYLYYYHFKDSQQRFRTAVANQERLKFEKIKAQYKSLQNHISPHFIFNCLGGLDSMVREKPEEASRVIYSLSDCLQHILITLEENTITLEEELSFIKKYEQLLQIRFPDSIRLNIFIDEAHYKKKIPPCLLQMLVENAVKHNWFDQDHKLFIIISSLDGDRLSISNNCNKKINTDSNLRIGSGLENIRQRYLLLTEEQVVVEQTETLFTANLPLLNA